MVSLLDSASSTQGLSAAWGNWAVLLGKTLNSHSASVFTQLTVGTGEFTAGVNPVMA